MRKPLKARLAAELPSLLLLLALGLCVGLPSLRNGLHFEDEGCLAYGAERMLQGQVPNRDFVSLQPPLSYFTVAAVFKLFGVSLFSLRLLGLANYLALPLLIYGVARQFNGRLLSFAAAVPSLLLGVPHYGFVPLAVWPGNATALLAALAYLLALREPPRPALALASGVLTTVTALFRQDQGFYLFIALTVLNAVLRFANTATGAAPARPAESSPNENLSPQHAPPDQAAKVPGAPALNRLFLFWLAGLLVLALPCTVYWSLVGALPEMFRQLVLFPLTTYPKTSSLPFPNLRSGLAFGPDLLYLLFYLLPLLYLLVAFWVLWRIYRRCFDRREALITFLLAWSALFFCQSLARSDMFHLVVTLPPFFLLAACSFQWGLQRIRDLETRNPAHQASKAVVRISDLFALLSGAALIAFLWLVAPGCLPPRLDVGETLTLKRGGVRAPHAQNFQALISQLQTLAPADRSILCLPYQPMFYFLCERRNPTRWNYIWPGDQTPEEHQALIQQAKRDPPALVLLSGENVMRQYASDILDYIHSDYQLLADVKLWQIYVPHQPGSPP